MTGKTAENGQKPATAQTTPPSAPPRADEEKSENSESHLDARRLVRASLTASLATRHHELGSPYASLVTVATQPDGAPILLLSTLAVHTKNLLKDPNACLLFEAKNDTSDPLECGRVSVWGEIRETASPRAKARFLARHPSAEQYADFSDFAFFDMKITGAHYVGGFGRIRPMTPDVLLLDCSEKEEMIELEHGFLAHMNKDHAESIALYATILLNAPDNNWRLTGLDPAGIDLVAGQNALRLDFDEPVTTGEEMRVKLVSLSKEAREKRGH